MPITNTKQFVSLIKDPTAKLTISTAGSNQDLILDYALSYMASGNPTKEDVGKIKGYLDEVRQGSARPKSSTHFESGHGVRFESLQSAIAKFEAKPVAPSAKAVPAVASSGAKEVHELAYEVTRSGKTGSLADPREGNPGHLPAKPTAPLKGSAREADTRDVKPERIVKFEGDKAKGSVKHVSFAGLNGGDKGRDPRA